MIDFTLNIQKAKGLFFDSPKVLATVDKATRKALSRFGAFVRQTARQSIRARQKPSAPGTPPSSHTGVLKKFILFAYEPFQKSVIIGPGRTNQVFFDRAVQPATGTVPQVLEEGGSVNVQEVFRHGRWQRADLRSRRRLAGLPTRLRPVRVAARPYMKPAFDTERRKAPGLWAHSVRAAA